MKIVKIERQVGSKVLSIETGKMAKQADGAVVVRYGDSIVLVTAQSEESKRELDFFPLTVEYREKMAAAGKIPGSFFRREGRPSTKETVTSRLIDRPIRPLFDKQYKKEVQILSFVLSADLENDPDVLALVGASAALSISSIPFQKTLGAVRVGRIDGEYVINPTVGELESSELDFVVAGSKDAVVMVEGFAQQVPEQVALEALEKAHETIKIIVDMIDELKAAVGKEKQEVPPPPEKIPEQERLEKILPEKLKAVIFTPGKHERDAAVKAAVTEAIESIVDPEAEGAEEIVKRLKETAGEIRRDLVRESILNGRRVDGRSHKDIRPINVEVGLMPRMHGSALFTRGETQALVSATLGTAMSELKIDGLVEEYYERFILHYDFPPMSVGEVRPVRGPGRREIGHGVLAERSLRPVVPSYETFPYTIRIVSDILESNGSSSMASVCGGALAMMDAGVPLTSPVAGIAMGLVVDGDRCAILSDILGEEDHLGDMDFKVAGTENGITALQMDIKVAGISTEIMLKAMEQAREGRLFILAKMNEGLSAPRERISKYAPKMKVMQIDPDKIGNVIGPGGRVVRKIQEDFGVSVDIKDDGTLTIASDDEEGLEKAAAYIAGFTAEPEIGKIYKGRVTSTREFGAFVEILPGKDGLLHISEISDEYVKDIDSVIKEGDEVEVMVVDVDPGGKIRLSKKAVEFGLDSVKKHSRPPRRGGSGRGRR